MSSSVDTSSPQPIFIDCDPPMILSDVPKSPDLSLSLNVVNEMHQVTHTSIDNEKTIYLGSDTVFYLDLNATSKIQVFPSSYGLFYSKESRDYFDSNPPQNIDTVLLPVSSLTSCLRDDDMKPSFSKSSRFFVTPPNNSLGCKAKPFAIRRPIGLLNRSSRYSHVKPLAFSFDEDNTKDL